MGYFATILLGIVPEGINLWRIERLFAKSIGISRIIPQAAYIAMLQEKPLDTVTFDYRAFLSLI